MSQAISLHFCMRWGISGQKPRSPITPIPRDHGVYPFHISHSPFHMLKPRHLRRPPPCRPDQRRHTATNIHTHAQYGRAVSRSFQGRTPKPQAKVRLSPFLENFLANGAIGCPKRNWRRRPGFRLLGDSIVHAQTGGAGRAATMLDERVGRGRQRVGSKILWDGSFLRRPSPNHDPLLTLCKNRPICPSFHRHHHHYGDPRRRRVDEGL